MAFIQFGLDRTCRTGLSVMEMGLTEQGLNQAQGIEVKESARAVRHAGEVIRTGQKK